MNHNALSLARGLLCCAALLATAPAFADDDQPPPPRGDHDRGPRKPPQEAYDACNDLAQDDACTVDFGEHHITGKCMPDREDGSLFCRPDHMRPPKAAMDACQDKTAGDSCSVHDKAGSCVTLPDDKLACRPNS